MPIPTNSPEARRVNLRHRAAARIPLALADVAEEFGVSVDTIRRDLLALEAEGVIRRVRGGALPVAAPTGPALERLETEDAAGARIASSALDMVEDGMVLLLDGGATVTRLARALPDLPRSLVATPSPSVAAETLRLGIETVMIGGRLSRFGGIATGRTAERAIGGIAADLCFLGACGLEAGFGLSADDIAEAGVKRSMQETSARTVVLTGAAKLGRRARHRVVACDQLEQLVTDAGPADTRALADTGIEIRHV